MVKTQVQFPDHLYREAKRVASEYEMSFAEVVRRGVEQVIKAHPPGRPAQRDWKLPAPQAMGDALLPEEEWDMAHRGEA
jgi:hypothetical protein